jgi:hypothetical protein
VITPIQIKGRKRLVIFVHGFKSDNNTWKNSQGISFPKMLLENQKINRNYDFVYFDYYTKLYENLLSSNAVGNLFMKALNTAHIARRNLNIEDLGEHMHSVISRECSNYEKIYLIAHSMGGLVSKYCILKSLENENPSKLAMFMSLAVPHKGSHLAVDYASLVNNPQAFDLKPLSDLTNSLNDKWIKREKLPRTVYFQAQYDTVVPKNSSVGFEATKQEIVPCDDDHFSISKPETKTRHIYKIVEKLLIETIETSEVVSPSLQEFQDDGKYDDENFVLKMRMAEIHPAITSFAKQSFYNAEYITKTLRKRRNELKKISDLYTKIHDLYTEEFGKHLRGETQAGNPLISLTHDRISAEDNLRLKSSSPLVGAVHKKGMLHQIANQLDKEIWWSKDHSIDKLGEYKSERVNKK